MNYYQEYSNMCRIVNLKVGDVVIFNGSVMGHMYQIFTKQRNYLWIKSIYDRLNTYNFVDEYSVELAPNPPAFMSDYTGVVDVDGNKIFTQDVLIDLDLPEVEVLAEHLITVFNNLMAPSRLTKLKTFRIKAYNACIRNNMLKDIFNKKGEDFYKRSE